jgi:serine/threonine protein phosphatase PrpC
VSRAPRDRIVVASDGLSDNLHLAEIVEAVRKGPLDRSVEALGELGRKRMEAPTEGSPSKPDDLTLIAISQVSRSGT